MTSPINPSTDELPKDESPLEESEHLRHRAGLLDLSKRDRICLLGDDRHRFLNGQVTNNIRDLSPGAGCYTLITNKKGIIQGDATVSCLDDELILDLEPGHGDLLTRRLESFIVADDVEIVDVAEHFGLFSIQGPLAENTLSKASFIQPGNLPTTKYSITQVCQDTNGEVYVTNNSRTGSIGYDIYVANSRTDSVKAELTELASQQGGGLCGRASLETLRLEAGIPRYPIDMEPSILAPELGIENETISYSKGCYIGQEVINRIKSIGKVKRQLTGLIFESDKPINGLPIEVGSKQVGRGLSSSFSAAFGKNLGLGLLQTTAAIPGNQVTVKTESGEISATVSSLPFTSKA